MEPTTDVKNTDTTVDSSDVTDARDLIGEEVTTNDAPPSEADALSEQDLAETSRFVADHLIRSSQGFDVLKGLFHQAARAHLASSRFTLPVLNNIDKIEANLTDPVAFKKSFHTLLRDLDQFHGQLTRLGEKHEGRNGTPQQKDIPWMMEVTSEYSNLISHYEQVIQPLVDDLLATLKREYPEMVKIEE